MMTDEEKINNTLNKLQGWVLDTEAETITDDIPNKTITAEEVLNFFEDAVNYACSYINKTEQELYLLDVADTALCFWTAGLLWEKYNVRVNNQTDDTNPFGYGDKLIVQAKEMLKPNKSYGFYAY